MPTVTLSAASSSAFSGLAHSAGLVPSVMPGVDLVPTDPWVAALGPLLRALVDVGLVGAFGCLVLIALLPNDAGALSTRHLQAALWLRRSCTLLLTSLLVSSVTTLAFFLGQSLPQTLGSPATYLQFLQSTATGRSLLWQAGLAWAAGMVTFFSRRITHLLLATLPLLMVIVVRAQTGHSGNSAWHDLATSSWALHVSAISIWVGGVLAIAATIRADSTTAARLLGRFSRIALICYIAVWVSGAVNSAIRLHSTADLVTTAYGSTVLVKLIITATLGLLAWQLRARVVSASTNNADAEPRTLVRWLGAELLLMVAAGLAAVKLSATAPPVDPDAGVDAFTTERAVLGFNPPPAPNLLRLSLTTWRPDGFWIIVAFALAALYIAGWRQLRRRGDAWPVARLVGWLLGCALLVYATSGPMGVYGRVLFSAHMMQHLELVLVAPILLIAGAPTTLALRALPADRGDHGPREWLLALLHSRFLRIVSHPIIAFFNFAGGFFILYFSGLFEFLMRSHIGHTFMQLHFLLTGYMFIWCITGVDPSPRPLPAPAKVALAVFAAPFHAIFSVIIMQSTTTIAADYYSQFTRLYDTNLLRDQYLGASLGWAFGEVPMVVIIIIAVVQWVRADAREAARQDRLDDERRAREASAHIE